MGKTKKLRKVWQLLLEARCELEDLRSEQQREKEGLLENVRQLTSDLRLQQLLIDQVRSRAIDQVRSRAIDQVRSRAIDQVRSRAIDQVRAWVVDQVRSRAIDQVRSRAIDQVRSRAIDQVRSRAIDQVRSRAIDQVRLTGHRPDQVIDEVRPWPHIIDLRSGHRAAAWQAPLDRITGHTGKDRHAAKESVLNFRRNWVDNNTYGNFYFHPQEGKTRFLSSLRNKAINCLLQSDCAVWFSCLPSTFLSYFSDKR